MIIAADSAGFDLWASQFPSDYVPLIYDLIRESWDSVREIDLLLEVPITRKLCHQLRQSKNRAQLPFRIDPESSVLGDDGEETGRLDLRFSHGHNENVYFSIECKRLRVILKTGVIAKRSSEYVKEGMCRYFNGQYAVGLNRGGMLGYVMDGDISKAKVNVAEAIHRHRTELMMAPSSSVKESCIFPEDDRMFDTCHTQPPGERFLIHHLLLAMQ